MSRGLTAARLDVACSHCSNPVPAGLFAADKAEQFCCHGCETVYFAIREQGLDRYYQLRKEDAESTQRPHTTDRSYREFDDAAFQSRYCRALPDGTLRTELFLEGVHCAACVWLVEHATSGMRAETGSNSSVRARLDIGRSAAEITFDPKTTTLSAVARRLDTLGYASHPYRGADARDLRVKEERALMGRIGVAFAVAGNVMVMAVTLYSGLFTDMDAETEQLFRWVSFALTIPAFFWSARVFFVGAWKALKARMLHMDLPIAVGLSAGFIGGTVNVFRGTGEIYFDSVATLIFLLLVGRWLQLRQRRMAGDAAELLYSLAPSSARLVENDRVTEVPVERLAAGDIVEVRAGDTIPTDGVIVLGRSALDASVLTGESRAVDVVEGDRVHAGTLNIAALLQIRTEATGEDTRVGRLMQAVAEASRRRAPIVALTDHVIGYFVAVVLVLAAVTAGLWLWLDPQQALDHAVALLIVTCPCALGLATPLAVTAAVGKAAQRGILVKGGDAMERLAKPGLVLFDKTGTLTEGKIKLMQWLGDQNVQSRVAVLERQSAHPLARAVVAHFAAPEDLAIADISQTVGGGLMATVDGQALVVGSPAFVAQQVGELPAQALDWVGQLTQQAWTPVLIAQDGRVVAAMGFGDPIRPEAAACLRALEGQGMTVGILSGDHPDVVAVVAQQLGISPARAQGGATPEQKLAKVQAELRNGPVLMVGDGVNDSAALAAATVGISVHGGAEASLQAADVFLTEAGLAPIVTLITGARRTVRTIRRNILFSLLYNTLGAALAMAGLLSPLVAAILMPFSSLTVVSSSFKSRTFDAARKETQS
jgi:Cu2+-exporting ATPase